MESWLPWLVDKEETILDYLPENSRLIFIDPERSNRKVEELSRDENRIVPVLSQTWEVEEEALTKRLHVPFTKIFHQTRVPATSIKPFAETENSHLKVKGGNRKECEACSGQRCNARPRLFRFRHSEL